MGNELQRAKYTFMEGCRGKGVRYFNTFPERRWKKKKKGCVPHIEVSKEQQNSNFSLHAG